MNYVSQKIKIKPQMVRRVILIENDEPSYLWKFSIVNKYLKPRKGTERSLSYEAADYYRHIEWFLNYLLKNNINPEKDLKKVDLEIAQQFLTEYCIGLKNDGEKRGMASIKYFQSHLTMFLKEIQDSIVESPLKGINLVDVSWTNGGRRKNTYALTIIGNRDISERPVNRECPDFFAREILIQARKYDSNVWIACIFEYLTGIRGGWICNLRHPHSIYGGNVEYKIHGTELLYLRINMNKEAYERPLRDDNVKMPSIKHPKSIDVDNVYKEVVFSCYLEYLELTSSKMGIKRQVFGPLLVNKNKTNGFNMAFTKDSLDKAFKKLVIKYVIPELKKQGREEKNFAENLEKTKWGMHMLREGFSCRFLEEGRGKWWDLMRLRGDKDPSTAVTYLIKGKVCNNIVKDLAEDYAKIIKGTSADDIGLPPYRL